MEPFLAPQNYVPSTEDVLHSRVRTTGILDCRFTINKVPFEFVDVGGARVERRKWILSFHDVKAVFFLCAASGFDLTLEEDGATNRLTESVNLFAALVNNKHFSHNVPIILLLNKMDLLADKIRVKNIGEYFPDFKVSTSLSFWNQSIEVGSLVSHSNFFQYRA